MQPQTIHSPIQIVVEGRDIAEFIQALLTKTCSNIECQIQNFGGISEFRAFIKALSIAPNFIATVNTIAVFRDAESDPNAAFRSIAGSLSSAGLNAPASPGSFSQSHPRVGVFLLPDNNNPGMIESLCLDAVSGDPAMKCVDVFFDCVAATNLPQPANRVKARLQAFLSTREKHTRNPGQAAKRGLIPFDSSPLEPLCQFLQKL